MPGTYLLDTAPLIYLMGQEDAVPVAVRRELADEPAVILPRELDRYGFTKLDLTDTAFFGLARLPSLHRDPFDRLLIVQAKLTGSVLVSPDKIFAQYPVTVFW